MSTLFSATKSQHSVKAINPNVNVLFRNKQLYWSNPIIKETKNIT